MTFLNPLALVGLAAATLPLLIHLLSLRKLKTIEFSSLWFLKELQKTTMRRLRLRQWLLLLFRTLLIVFLVLTFARPAMRSSVPAFAGGRATTTIVLLLDDSPSMNVRNENGLVFDQAKEAAKGIVKTIDPADRVFFVKLSELRQGSQTPPFVLPSGTTSVLNASSPSQRRVSYRSAMSAAISILNQSQAANREVYFLTDAQATQVTAAGSGSDTLTLNDPAVRVYVVTIPSPREENLSASSLEIRSRILARDKQATIQVIFQNYGQKAISNSVASLFLDGTRVAQQTLEIPARASQTATFNATPRRRGILTGYVLLEEDALEIDNTYTFALPVPEHMRIVTSSTIPDEAKFVNLALTLRSDSTLAGVHSVTSTVDDRLAAVDLNTVDVLILCGARSLANPLANRINDFLRGGQGLILFPPSVGDSPGANNILLPTLGIPPFTADTLGNTVPGTDASSGSFLSFARIDFDHPLFAGMFEQHIGRSSSVPNIESPRIQRAVVCSPGRNGIPIIQLSDGRPFLTEYSVGEGRVLLFAIEAGTAWSDFPTKGVFAPLLYRAVAYLAAGRQAPASTVVGEPLQLFAKIPSETRRKQFFLRSPSGIDERIVPSGFSSTGVATFRTDRTEEAGVYTLSPTLADQKDALPLQAGVVRIAPEESDLRKATDEEWKRFWVSAGVQPEQVHTLLSSERLETAIHESRFGVELWKAFLALALVCALAEMILGREKASASEPSEGKPHEAT